MKQEQTTNSTENVGEEIMAKAYKLSSSLIRDRISKESKEDLELLDTSTAEDVLVINGTYDHIHQVLSLTNIPFQRLNPDQVSAVELRPDQTVFVNCGTSFPAEAARKLATFVHAGGQLITTDWALKHVLEVAFPDMVRYNEQPTQDEVVRIEVINREDPVIKGFLDEKADPVWWLEGSSYPIEILSDKVEVMIRSKELGEKYGQEPVVIKFKYGKGIVYHMISHFYLQRTETRDKVQSTASSNYAMSKGGSASTNKLFMEADAEGLDFGTVQSANTSAEFITRSIISQKKRHLKKDRGQRED